MILSFAVSAVALGLGLFCAAVPSGYSCSRAERLFIGFAAGYGLLAYIIYLTGMTVGFNRPVLAVVLAAAAGFGARGFFLFFKSAAPSIISRLRGLAGNREEAGLAIWSALFLTLLIFGAFLPPTAHDALCYHLSIPGRWARDGVIGYYPYLVNSLFPFLIQIYYGVAILFKVDYAAHFFHLFCLIGTLAGTFALSRRFSSSWAGWISVLILISTPGIFNQANLPLNDIALVFFSFAMLYAVYLGVENGFSMRFFILAGMLGGFALGIKYFAVLHIFAAGAGALLFAVKQKIKPLRVLGIIGIFGLFAFLFGSVWYIRSWVLDGNPVYPYFSNIFGTAADIGYDLEKQGYGKSLIDLLLSPWRVTLFPKNFGGTWSQIGVLYLIFLPLIFLKSHSPKLIFLKISLFVYFLCWFFLVQNLRFLYFALPILAVLIAFQARPYRWVLYLTLVLNTFFAVYHSKEAVVFLKSREPRDAYLARTDVTFQDIQKINQIVPAKEKILVGDHIRLYYFNAEPVRADEFFKRRRSGWTDPMLVKKLSDEGIYWISLNRKIYESLDFLQAVNHVERISGESIVLYLNQGTDNSVLPGQEN